MKVNISKALFDLYKSKHRNMDYSLEFLINSMDPETCETAINMVSTLDIGSEKISVEINEDNIASIKEIIKKDAVDEKIVEILLWVAILQPEI